MEMEYTNFNINNPEQQIDAMFQKVKGLSYNNINEIMRTTAEVERLFSRYRNNTELLILQTRLQILNSQEQKARAIANQVWQIGGNIRIEYEKMYLSDLINLGMIDMATILIKPRFQNIAENIKIFPLEMIRYALITGNTSLLKKISSAAANKPLFQALTQFANTYQHAHYDSHFANIQKIVLENIGNVICGYDFNFYTDRGFTDIDIILYFSNYDFNLNQYKMLINNKIDGYCLTAGIKRIHNLNFVFRKIKDHPKI